MTIKGLAGPRPANSYRASRRNRCLRVAPKSTWGEGWYVPAHRARYVRGWPSFARKPGKYPVSMSKMTAIYREQRAAAKAAAKHMLRGLLGIR